MYIGLEARAASQPQAGGFKTYTAGLLHGLSQLAEAREHRFLVGLDRSYPTPLPTHMEPLVLPAAAPLLGTLYREQWQLPRALARAGVQLAHFPCNVAAVRCPVSYLATIHDLAPLRDSPLHNKTLRRLRPFALWLYWRLLIPWTARHAHGIITDSTAICQEIVQRLQIPLERIFVVAAAAGPDIRRVDLPMAQAIVREAYGVMSPYLLAMASREPRKNTRRTLQAYSLLASTVRQQYPLVIIVSHTDLGQQIGAWGTRMGLGGTLHLAVTPNGQQLSALYSAAHAFVFPSLYEGFGLPVLEAMHCGTPVITSRRSSLPEVAGEAAVLVDPVNVESIHQGIECLVADTTLRSELIQRGLARCQDFTWEKTAATLLRVYDWAVKQLG